MTDALAARPSRRRSRPRPILPALTILVFLGAALPSAVQASQSWTLEPAPRTLELGVPATVRVDVTNTSTNGGGGGPLGCATVGIPALTQVDSVTFVSASNGKTWTGSIGGGTLTLYALTAGDRVIGGSSPETASFDVLVTGTAAGSAPWTATAFTNADCQAAFAGPVSAMFTVIDPAAPPNVVDDSYSVTRDVTLAIAAPGVLGNDSDPNGDGLSAVLDTPPASGSLTLAADGSFSYTPDPGFLGADEFTYVASDGGLSSTPATVTLSVEAAPNVAPVATGDLYLTTQNVALSAAAPGVLANDADADGDPLSAVLVSGVTDGALTLAADGGFTYVPAVGFTGADGFRYQVFDGSSLSNVVTVAIDVGPTPNTAPVAASDAATASKNVALAVPAPGLLANDADADGDALIPILDTGPSDGTLTLAADGGWTYTPEAGFAGADAFTYHATDGIDDSATVTVAITVVDDPPVATDDSYATTRGVPLIVAGPGVLANDSDPNGDALAVTGVASGPSNGTLLLGAGGGFTYTPLPTFSGVDSFSYTVTDGASQVTGTAAIDVSNGLPIAADDSAQTTRNADLAVPAPGVLANDTDPDPLDLLGAVLAGGPSNGSVQLDSDGAYRYEPDPGYVGPDSFTYVVSDGLLSSAVATVSLLVVNTPPVAVGDAYTVTGATKVVAAPGVLVNDIDLDGDSVTAALVSSPSRGTLSLAADGSFTYVPNAGYSGADSFSYRAWDGDDSSPPALVSLVVVAPTPTPTPTPTSSPAPTPTPAPTTSPSPSTTPTPGPTPTRTPAPSRAPEPTRTPTVTDAPSPDPEPRPDPGASPAPSDAPASSEPPLAAGPAGPPPIAPGATTFDVEPVELGPIDGLFTASFGDFGIMLEWAVPALVLTVPGLLLVLAVAAQIAGGLAWLPFVRRWLAGIGVRRWNRREGRPAT